MSELLPEFLDEHYKLKNEATDHIDVLTLIERDEHGPVRKEFRNRYQKKYGFKLNMESLPVLSAVMEYFSKYDMEFQL